jgi:hypothetical protein
MLGRVDDDGCRSSSSSSSSLAGAEGEKKRLMRDVDEAAGDARPEGIGVLARERRSK